MKNPNAVTEMEGATVPRPMNFETIRQRAVCQCGIRVGFAALALLAFACFTFLPLARAVSPAPDGCYPGLTTAEGCNALFSLAGGQGNTAIGHDALFSDTSGSWNTGVGAVALGFNNGDFNTAVGTAALLLNTTGGANTANGALALLHNDTGSSNTAVGNQALFATTTGSFNTATGSFALTSNSTGTDNTAIGAGALENNTASSNTAVGASALLHNTFLSENTAVGASALANSIGAGNTAVGFQALITNTSGDNNTAIGHSALHDCTGSQNIAIGGGAGQSIASGNNNIDIGFAVSGSGSDVGVIRIGGPNQTTKCFIGGIRGVATVNNDAVNVVIDGAGQLGTMSSSRRFKKDIKAMDNASESILEVKPVMFHYKGDSSSRPEFGLIAEQVAEVNPDLVVRDQNGEIYTVRYDAVNAMLLNEFLKEHKKVRQLEATVTVQEKRIAALAAGLQRVSTRVEMSKPAPKVVVNNP